jgi:hypothetical protein
VTAMLRVKKQQFAVFAALAKERFLVKLAAHLRAQFPRRSAALGEEGLVELAEYACEQGKEYRFFTERQVASFAGLLVLLGRDFEAGPRYRWAQKMLNDRSFLHPTQKLDALWLEVDRRDLDDEDGTGDEEELFA